MNVLQAMGSRCHCRNRSHYRVGGLRRPIGILSRLHVIEVGDGGHAPSAAAQLGASTEFRAGRVDGVVQGLIPLLRPSSDGKPYRIVKTRMVIALRRALVITKSEEEATVPATTSCAGIPSLQTPIAPQTITANGDSTIRRKPNPK
jgi:hypothetical protein